MADFTNAVQPVSSPEQSQGGVVDSSLASGLGSAANVLSGVGESLFGSKAIAARKLIDKGNENSYIASYEQQQLKLADAVDQGGMSSDEARMRMRANYSKALSNFHGDPDDLAAAHARIVNTSGLGKVIETGNRQEQNENATISDTMKAGWTSANKSREDQLLDAAHYQAYQLAKDQLGAQQQQVALQRANIGLEADKVQLGTARINQQGANVSLAQGRLALLEKQQEVQSRTALGSLQDNYNHKFQNDLNDVQSRLDNHQIDQKQAVMEIQQKLATVTQLVGGVGSNAGGSYISDMLTPMKMRADNMIAYANGDMDRKLLDNANFKAEAVQKAIILGDKDAAQTVAASDLFKNAPFAVQKAAGDHLLNILKKNGSSGKPADILPDTPEDKESARVYFGHLKVGMSQSLAGLNKNPESTDAEIKQNLSQTLKSITAYGKDTKPQDLNDVVDFIASADFGKYVTKNGGSIPADVTSQAADLLKQQYADVVTPLLVKKYKDTVEPMVGMANLNPFSMVDTKPVRDDTVSQSISPVFNGSGVMFMANDTKDIDAVKKARQLNNDVSPILNRLVRLDAHLAGNQDYRKAWEDHYANAFTPQPEKVDGNGG